MQNDFEIAVKQLFPTLEFKHTLNNMNPTAVFGAKDAEAAVSAITAHSLQPAYILDGQIICKGELIRVSGGNADGTRGYDIQAVKDPMYRYADCAIGADIQPIPMEPTAYPYYITVNYKDGVNHNCLRCCIDIPGIGVASIWVELETAAFSVEAFESPNGETEYLVYDDCDIAILLEKDKILRTNKHNIFKCVRYA